MLVELHIRDFTIIDRLDVNFSPGLNVMTGETGAGKSIVLDALELALGGRASGDLVRTGAEVARIEAIFDLKGIATASSVRSMLESAGIEQEGHYLILAREVQRSGRSIGRINRHAAPSSLLQSVGRALVDIHGQGDHQLLLNPHQQLRFLDGFLRLEPEVRRLTELVDRLRTLQRQVRELEELLGQRERERDLIQYQLQEIEAVSPMLGEDEQLAAQRRVLANAEALLQGVGEVYRLLYGEGDVGVLDQLGQAYKQLTDLSRLDPALRAECDALDALIVEAGEVARRLRSYRDQIEVDPDRLAEVDARLESISRLKRKYGGSIDAVLSEAGRLRSRLSQLEGTEISLEALRQELAELVGVALPVAWEISELRRRGATHLSARVTSLMEELGLGNSTFHVRVAPRAGPDLPQDQQVSALSTTGFDDVEYLVSLNPGEPPKPLAKVASGGELARLMLAVKSALSATDEVPCLVFDEIDVGVGGRSGGVIGRRLWRLSSGRQVICVTHLAQVASYADNHLVVTKDDRGGRVKVAVTCVEGEDRIRELAAMLAGPEPGSSAIASAVELLEEASSFKAREGSSVHG